MRKNLLLSEVVTLVANTPPDEQSAALKSYENAPLLLCLRGAFCPQLKYDVGAIDFTPSNRPIGTDMTSLSKESRRLYIFQEDFTKITLQRKREILLQILENVHVSDARFLCAILKKDLSSIKGLTAELVEKTFPGLLSWKGTKWEPKTTDQNGTSELDQQNLEEQFTVSKVGQPTLQLPKLEQNATKSETKSKPASRSRQVIS
jgi:hypothetical protein